MLERYPLQHEALAGTPNVGAEGAIGDEELSLQEVNRDATRLVASAAHPPASRSLRFASSTRAFASARAFFA